MKAIVTAEQMRELDRETIAGIGLPGAVLMENAGRAVVSELCDRGRPGGHVAVICGAGNNGGDGYVIARVLRELGVDAEVYLACQAGSVKGDAALHLRAYQQCGGPVSSVAGGQELAQAGPRIRDADVVVDAIFGTGLARAVEGHYARVIELINEAAGRIVSVDVPSGLCADSGAVLGIAVQPEMTVTMAFLKVGLASAPGFARAGEVRVAEIGIPQALATGERARAGLLEAADVARLVPVPSPATYKNRRGHLLVVAGSPGKWGAARLTAAAGLRTGAGLVTLASTAGFDRWAPDPIMTAEIDLSQPSSLAELAAGMQAVAIGPGLDPGERGAALTRHALATVSAPLVVDAESLNHLGTDLDAVAARTGEVVLTPHPGEAARLLGSTTAAVEADRLGAVRELARRSAAVVILKGARTAICDGRAHDDFVWVNPTATPALATAGSGDVLTGVIAALAAGGADAGDAARLGVFVHGRAGELVAGSIGPVGATAQDLVESLPRAAGELARA